MSLRDHQWTQNTLNITRTATSQGVRPSPRSRSSSSTSPSLPLELDLSNRSAVSSIIHLSETHSDQILNSHPETAWTYQRASKAAAKVGSVEVTATLSKFRVSRSKTCSLKARWLGSTLLSIERWPTQISRVTPHHSSRTVIFRKGSNS